MRIVLFLFIFSSYGFISPEAFKSTEIEGEEFIINETINNQFKIATSAISEDVIKFILNDKDNKIRDDFVISDYFKDNVYFWFSIYTQFTSQQVVIHDKKNLSLVYNTLDFSELHNSDINRYAKAKLQADLSQEYSNKVKRILAKLHKDEDNLNDEELGILKAIKKSIELPDSRSKKKIIFKELSQNIRTQTGQRDMIFNATLRSLPYLDFLYRQMDNFNIPRELLAISFIESSFNYRAESYAGAMGVWQFMPWTSRSFLPKIDKYIDYRKNPIIASLGAFHLLKQNIQILKRWDLAIPAYNFGPTTIQRFRLKYKGTTTLPIFLEETKDKNVGFASKNYFSEFLALAHVLAYKEKIFNISGYDKSKLKFDTKKLKVYVTKCHFKPSSFYRLLKKSSPHTDELNSHFKKTKANYKRGKLIVSDVNLTWKKYFKLKDKDLTKYRPKDLYKLASKYRCK